METVPNSLKRKRSNRKRIILSRIRKRTNNSQNSTGVSRNKVSTVADTRYVNGEREYLLQYNNGSESWIPEKVAKKSLTSSTWYIIESVGPRCRYYNQEYYMVKYKGFEEWYELLAENVGPYEEIAKWKASLQPAIVEK